MPPQVREPGLHPALPAQPQAARPAWPGWGGRRAIGCSLHGTHLTGTRRPTSPAVGAASWAGCSVPQPCPCPCPTLRPGDARWPEGTRSTEALLFLPHEMGVEEKTPEATFRRTKGQYITFGLTFLWLCRRGEGSTCGAGALHGSTLRKHSQTKAARPHSPAARRVSMAGTARGSQLPSGQPQPGRRNPSPCLLAQCGQTMLSGCGRHGDQSSAPHRQQHRGKGWDKGSSTAGTPRGGGYHPAVLSAVLLSHRLRDSPSRTPSAPIPAVQWQCAPKHADPWLGQLTR